jgi:S1-C subfamily serine protease
MDADAENGGGARLAAAPPPPRRPVSPPAAKKDNWALRSVLKIFVARIDPNYGLPWQKSPQRTATGSGFVVDVAEFQDVVDLSEVGVGAGAAASGEGDDAGGGGASAATKTTTATGDLMILTNAHVVSNAVTVYVRRPGSAKKWPATVACVARQCDLALLRVADRGFWGGGAAGGGGGEAELPALRPLHFAARVPQVQENLVVAGYPTGGDALSLTSGIVSRVAMVRYSAYGRLIGVQS